MSNSLREVLWESRGRHFLNSKKQYPHATPPRNATPSPRTRAEAEREESVRPRVQREEGKKKNSTHSPEKKKERKKITRTLPPVKRQDTLSDCTAATSFWALKPMSVQSIHRQFCPQTFPAPSALFCEARDLAGAGNGVACILQRG